METKKTSLPRRRRGQKKKSEKTQGTNPGLFSLSVKARKGFFLTLLLVDLYLISCVFPGLSGSLGRGIHGVFYQTFGFCLVIPLLHVGYQSFMSLFDWKVEGLGYQILGTLSLFFACELFWGLSHVYEVISWKAPFIPGAFSLALTLVLLRLVGRFGTFICAMGGIFFSLLCYGLSLSGKFEGLYPFFIASCKTLGGIFASLPKAFGKKKSPTDVGEGENGSSEDSLSDATAKTEEVRIIRRRAGQVLNFPGALEDDSGEDERDMVSSEKGMDESFSAKEEFPHIPEEEINDELSAFPGESVEKTGKIEDFSDFENKSIAIENDHGEFEEKPWIVSESTDSGEAVLVDQDDPEEVDILDEDFMLPLQVEPGRFPPPLNLLGPSEEEDLDVETEELLEKGKKIIETLLNFGIEATLVETVAGPTVIQYRIQLAPGIKVSKVAGLNNDLAVALAVSSLRIEAPIPGKPYIGVEIPNPSRKTVSLRSLVEDPGFLNTRSSLPLPMGVSIDGRLMVAHLEEMPHLLVAGTTGAGKSVFISNCLIGLSFLRRPEELRFLLIDPKRVEMTLYERMPHLLTKPVVDPKKAVDAFSWAINEMERRYALFAGIRARDLKGYNKKQPLQHKLPNIVIVVDELADLMMTSPKEIEEYICRIAQKARATGIHLVLATQRPSVNVITGLIKANIPARVAFSLPTQADSRTVLDTGGAERLLGKGDCLHLTARLPKPLRLQSGWIDESYIVEYIEYLHHLFGAPEYVDIGGDRNSKGGGAGDAKMEDPLLPEAVELVMDTGIASASRLQRHLRVGFTRAARLVDCMEDLGIVGPQEGAKAREILMSKEEAEDTLEQVLA